MTLYGEVAMLFVTGRIDALDEHGGEHAGAEIMISFLYIDTGGREVTVDGNS